MFEFSQGNSKKSTNNDPRSARILHIIHRVSVCGSMREKEAAG